MLVANDWILYWSPRRIWTISAQTQTANEIYKRTKRHCSSSLNFNHPRFTNLQENKETYNQLINSYLTKTKCKITVLYNKALVQTGSTVQSTDDPDENHLFGDSGFLFKD